MSAIILDTETTGIDNPEVVETAWLYVDISGNVVDPGGQVDRWKPSKPISLGAMAVHGIMDEDLIGAPPSASFRLPAGVEYIVGHNVDYDWSAIGKPDVKRICTLAMCRSLWPDTDSHTQGAMMYLLEREIARDLLRGTHSAGVDAVNCRVILTHILERIGPLDSFEQLWDASELMRIPTVMTFGKHKGMAIVNVPRDYKRWLLGQPDVDVYLRKALET